MKTLTVYVAAAVLFNSQFVHAAIKSFEIKNQITTITNGVSNKHLQKKSYPFQVEIIGDDSGHKQESQKWNQSFITAKKDERYSIRLHNPLPVRVAVNLTVDGLNSISGKPSGISDGQKWMIDPHSSITIKGWQVDQNELRRFYFTDKPKSYVEWRSRQLNQDLTVNAGVIGAAFFWNKEELQQYYDSHPAIVSLPGRCGLSGAGIPTLEKNHKAKFSGAVGGRKKGNLADRMLDAPQLKEKQEAATGMGEREHHATRTIEFNSNAGMYQLSDAVVIYYDFEKPARPNPFPSLSFAPEMP